MKTVNISGFGGGYEAACQKMLSNGLKFLEDKPDFDWSGYRQYANIFGICSAENKDAKALDNAILDGVEGASGAMHQAVVNHLHCIHKQGRDKWVELAGKDRVYEVE